MHAHLGHDFDGPCVAPLGVNRLCAFTPDDYCVDSGENKAPEQTARETEGPVDVLPDELHKGHRLSPGDQGDLSRAERKDFLLVKDYIGF